MSSSSRCADHPAIRATANSGVNSGTGMSSSRYKNPEDTPALGEVTSREDMPIFYYEMDFRPVKYVVTDEDSFIGWGHLRCFDCIADGGTQVKPDFWDD